MQNQGIINKQFGMWTILEDLGNGQVYCRCQCGAEATRDKYSITHGKSYSCGCHRKEQRKQNSIANKDLTGKKFNFWTVIEDNGEEQIKCRCICGKEKYCNRYHIINGASKSCGCKKGVIANNIVGQKINEWTILEELGKDKVKCQCSCGTIKINSKYNVVNGRSQSCGCKAQESKTQLKSNTVGQTFNDWTIIEELGHGKVKCRCSCGIEKVCVKNAVTSGKSKSCGHNTNKKKNIENQKINNWTILKELGQGYVECQCSCGTVTVMKKALITGGYSKSCGCKKTELMQATLMRTYGEITANKASNPREQWQIETVNDKEKFVQYISNNFESKPTIKGLSKGLGVNEASIGRVIKQFGVEALVDISPLHSEAEKEIREYISSIYDGEVKHNIRKIIGTQELDIYIPDLKLAIEFNGNFWHSSVYRETNYHQQKTFECVKRGIRLIHIFEYEWKNVDSKQKIQNLLKDILVQTEKIYARQTEVQEISTEEAKEFCEKYHLQGYSNSNVKIGLKFKSELVGVITFGTPRFQNESEYELIRLCWKPGVTVIGGTQKLFSHFIKAYKPESIITYADISKFTGNIYLRLEFKVDSFTPPNYVWVMDSRNYCKVLSRYQTQKHKLIEAGLGTKDQTENEIMMSLGYLKIYDSGNIKLIWLNKENT